MGISKWYVSEPRSHPPSLSCSQANIMINDNGRACLADFCLLTIVPDQSTDTSSHIDGGMTQWMSPELLDPERFDLPEGQRTKESDCYALGMVIYEILSGQAPFAPLTTIAVILRVLEGRHPGRPEGEARVLFTDDIWRTLELCWEHQPGKRIRAEVVLQRLEKTSPLPRPRFDKDGIAETSIKVCCNPHLRWDVILTLSQKGKERKGPEHKEEEKVASECKEELEVCCNPHLFRRNAILTPL